MVDEKAALFWSSGFRLCCLAHGFLPYRHGHITIRVGRVLGFGYLDRLGGFDHFCTPCSHQQQRLSTVAFIAVEDAAAFGLLGCRFNACSLDLRSQQSWPRTDPFCPARSPRGLSGLADLYECSTPIYRPAPLTQTKAPL